jgi:hypothetical protein
MVYFCNLKVEAGETSKNSSTFQQTTHHIPEDCNILISGGMSFTSAVMFIT